MDKLQHVYASSCSDRHSEHDGQLSVRVVMAPIAHAGRVISGSTAPQQTVSGSGSVVSSGGQHRVSPLG